jgi:putative endonuclease
MSSQVKPETNSNVIGQQVEVLAQAYLEQNGLQIIERNFNCKAGEIDLIGWLSNTLVFVEVRYRKSTEYGHPLETVTRSKQRKLILAAQYYLFRYKNRPPFSRFDVLSATGSISSLNWEWIQSAFQVQ